MGCTLTRKVVPQSKRQVQKQIRMEQASARRLLRDNGPHRQVQGPAPEGRGDTLQRKENSFGAQVRVFTRVCVCAHARVPTRVCLCTRTHVHTHVSVHEGHVCRHAVRVHLCAQAHV